jgi:hypothetical protein
MTGYIVFYLLFSSSENTVTLDDHNLLIAESLIQKKSIYWILNFDE